jgi:hypothetical protein
MRTISDDFSRSTCGNDQTEPGIDDEVRHAGFGSGRDVGKLRRPLAAGDEEAFNLAVADLRREHGERVERQIDDVAQ